MELTGPPGCGGHGSVGVSWFPELMRRGEEKLEGRGEPAHADLPEAPRGGEGRGARTITIDQMQPPFLKGVGGGRTCVSES